METPVWFIVPQMNGARTITVDMKESVLSGRASGQCDTRGHECRALEIRDKPHFGHGGGDTGPSTRTR